MAGEEKVGIRSAVQVSKDMVIVFAKGPIEHSQLRSTLNATSSSLVNIDVYDALLLVLFCM
jgi:hypothetical protein